MVSFPFRGLTVTQSDFKVFSQQIVAQVGKEARKFEGEKKRLAAALRQSEGTCERVSQNITSDYVAAILFSYMCTLFHKAIRGALTAKGWLRSTPDQAWVDSPWAGRSAKKISFSFTGDWAHLQWKSQNHWPAWINKSWTCKLHVALPPNGSNFFLRALFVPCSNFTKTISDPNWTELVMRLNHSTVMWIPWRQASMQL